MSGTQAILQSYGPWFLHIVLHHLLILFLLHYCYHPFVPL